MARPRRVKFFRPGTAFRYRTKRAATGVALVTLLDVETNGDQTYNLTFDGPIEIDFGVVPDSAFTIADLPPDAIRPPNGGGSCIVAIAGPNLTGEIWSMDAQPNWLLTPTVFPISGGANRAF